MFSKFIVKEEIMCGEKYWMIYHKFLFFTTFYERWNTYETALKRLENLNKRKFKV